MDVAGERAVLDGEGPIVEVEDGSARIRVVAGLLEVVVVLEEVAVSHGQRANVLNRRAARRDIPGERGLFHRERSHVEDSAPLATAGSRDAQALQDYGSLLTHEHQNRIDAPGQGNQPFAINDRV